MNEQAYKAFKDCHHKASIKLQNRDEAMAAAVADKFLECNLELLGLTSVKDKLQDKVKSTIELLCNAIIKIWMLIGDKIKMATCITILTKLVV